MTVTFQIADFATIIKITLAILVVINLILAWRIWVSNRKHPVNIFYALSVLMTALWTFALMGTRITSNSFVISLYARLTYFAPIFIGVFFWFFTYYFPFKIAKLSRRFLILFFGSTLFVIIFTILPDVFIAGQVLPEQRFKPEISRFWHSIYGIYFLAVMALSFRNLLMKYKQSVGIWRLRLKQVLIATIVAASGGIVFALIIPILYN